MAKIRDGSTYLSAHLSANDYYAEGESVTGTWIGKAAVSLGLVNGRIRSSDVAFERLRQNQHPQTGKRLTERISKNRVAFFDFQCSAPKSVSLLAVTFGDERLREAHDTAAREAFEFLEKFSARRVRTGAAAWSNDVRITSNVCAAAFTHDASRALDAQLHTHFVTANVTFDASAGSWCALTESEILKAIRCCGKVYQAALATAVVDLGYEIEHARDEKGRITGFEITGVTEGDRTIASRRRAVIDAAIIDFERAHGRAPSKKEVDRIVRETRDRKLAEITTAEVRSRQLAAFSPARQAALRGIVEHARHAQRPRPTAISAEVALARARDHLFERTSVHPAHELLAEALNEHLGATKPQELIHAIRQGAADLQFLAPADIPERALIGTAEGLRDEVEAIGYVDRGMAAQPPLAARLIPVPDFLSDNQRSCIEGILDSTDTVTALRGVAGAGKTTVLTAIQAGLTHNNLRSFYCAPTASAADVLKAEGFSNATTLSRFLLCAEREYASELRDGLIVVDEAGLISARQGAALFQLAERAGARVLLVGDSRQHSAVEAGDFLAILESHSRLRAHELTEIRRQTTAAYRTAIETLARGDARAGLIALDTLGYLTEAGDDYITRAVQVYLKHEDKKCILVAPTWAEIDALTVEILARKREQQELGAEQTRSTFASLSWTTAQKRSSANYRPGLLLSVHQTFAAAGLDAGTTHEVLAVTAHQRLLIRDHKGQERELDPKVHSTKWDVGEQRRLNVAVGDLLLIRQNLKSAHLTNGDVLTVQSVRADGEIVAANARGAQRTIPATFLALTHGYAVTSHKSQGRTADHVIVCAARLDAKATYVAFSRGRHSATCFTPNKDALIAGLPQRATSRLAALDVLQRTKRRRTSPVARRARTRTWFRLLAVAAKRAARAACRLIRRTPRL